MYNYKPTSGTIISVFFAEKILKSVFKTTSDEHTRNRIAEHIRRLRTLAFRLKDMRDNPVLPFFDSVYKN